MKNIHYLFILLSISLFSPLCSQEDTITIEEDYYTPKPTLRYEDFSYSPLIKTIQLRNNNFELSQAAIRLSSNEQLTLSFDYLSPELQTYTAKIIHCNANWLPSDMDDIDYIEGFSELPINDYAFANGTEQKYVHYSLNFPDETTRITQSGNYILKVYANNDPTQFVLTKRFVVYNPLVEIETNIHPASLIAESDFKQEVDFIVNHENYPIDNPYGNIKVIITQNNNWNNAITDLQPSMVNGQLLTYNYEDENLFSGGNEFRHIDLKNLDYLSSRILTVNRDTRENIITLKTDTKRAFLRYSFDNDINGDFLIKHEGSKESNISADYCTVTFNLKHRKLDDGNLYVYGAYNNWQCNKHNLLKYNPTTKTYHTSLTLKQGYYNYQYVFINDETEQVDETIIEGLHAETENNYTIYIYHQPPGAFYDQLIGYKHTSSR